MGNGLTKIELKRIRRWLDKVFVGPAEQDEFIKTIEHLDQLIKGKHGTATKRRGNNP